MFSSENRYRWHMTRLHREFKLAFDMETAITQRFTCFHQYQQSTWYNIFMAQGIVLKRWIVTAFFAISPKIPIFILLIKLFNIKTSRHHSWSRPRMRCLLLFLFCSTRERWGSTCDVEIYRSTKTHARIIWKMLKAMLIIWPGTTNGTRYKIDFWINCGLDGLRPSLNWEKQPRSTDTSGNRLRPAPNELSSIERMCVG